MRLVNDCPLLLQLVILALGVARLTVLVTSDRITRGLRYRLERRYGRESYPGTLVRCPWCAGWWVGLAVASWWALYPIGTTEAMVPWALAMVGAVLAGHFAPNDDPPLYTVNYSCLDNDQLAREVQARINDPQPPAF